MNTLTIPSITHCFEDPIGIRNILSKTIIPSFLALIAYSSTSFADYTVWYDSETHQENQIYSGSTLLTPPSWACARKFTNPSYYRHLNTYHGTLDSDDFYKDIYVWVAKPGCPHTSSAFVEYTDGSQSFSPPFGAIAIEISTNYGSKWVDENGGWPSCNNCSGPFGLTDQIPKWDRIVGAIAILKTAIIEKNVIKFDGSVARIKPLLSSFVNDIDSSILSANLRRSKEDLYRLKNIEADALNQLSRASKHLDQCISENVSDNAYHSCDMAINKLYQFKSLWHSRD